MPHNSGESIYDKIRPHLDAADLIRRLGLNVVRTSGSEAYIDPLCHESESGESLQVNLHTGRWLCRACQSSGMGGDLFQLAEYVHTGGRAPTHGQGSSETRNDAIRWLAAQFAIPFEGGGQRVDPALDVVHAFAMAAHRHLLKSPKMLAWVQEKWGFDVATVQSYGIGFMPDPILPKVAGEAAESSSRSAFRLSGLGWYPSGKPWTTRFAGRVLFPYFEHGQALYLIGRATPSTPKHETGGFVPKYYKLPVHSDKRPGISPSITNEHLYNEAVMHGANEVGVLEGVTDCVAASAIGETVVSPVTVTFNAVDLERFIRKCHEKGIKRVWILFDNELSGSGNWGAKKAALAMVEGGLSARILTLPLGEKQRAARDEVKTALGAETFAEFERSDPRDRKKIILAAAGDDSNRHQWLLKSVGASKMDFAEWSAMHGAGATEEFQAVKRAGVDVIDLEIADAKDTIHPDDRPDVRLTAFDSVVVLIAHVSDTLARSAYCSSVAKAAGKGVTKAHVAASVANLRREVVAPKRKEEKAAKEEANPENAPVVLTLPPPQPMHTVPAAPVLPAAPSRSGAPAAIPLPTKTEESEPDRYQSTREDIERALNKKAPEEKLGKFIAQVIMRSMGWSPFRTPDELYLVRGAECIPVGINKLTGEFRALLHIASGLTPRKSSHSGCIAWVEDFLGLEARKVDDVSWSYVDSERSVFFPQGDALGRMLKISPGKVTRTRMKEAHVPAVSGSTFREFGYTESDGGIESALNVFRWTSISSGDRLVLVYWIACLPILRRIGTVPIVRIEGGAGSGKTRVVDAVSFLVNGRKGSSVPTSAALTSRMSKEMLTVDDNREVEDVDQSFIKTLLQASHLGAREKRLQNRDTGTIVERICGALLMNGIEPIHNGKPELVGRMLVLKCAPEFKVEGSPTASSDLEREVLTRRDAFWSEAVRRCAGALAIDVEHGERVGAMIEKAFGETRIGRLSAYLRIMYFAWVAGLPEARRAAALEALDPVWVDAFASIASGALSSLLKEELTVTVLRYVFDWGTTQSETEYQNAPKSEALEGKFLIDTGTGDKYLGPINPRQLCRFARQAGREMNGPWAITNGLKAGQLGARLEDGLEFVRAAGFDVSVEVTNKGRSRYTFRLPGTPPTSALPGLDDGGDTWNA